MAPLHPLHHSSFACASKVIMGCCSIGFRGCHSFCGPVHSPTVTLTQWMDLSLKAMGLWLCSHLEGHHHCHCCHHSSQPNRPMAAANQSIDNQMSDQQPIPRQMPIHGQWMQWVDTHSINDANTQSTCTVVDNTTTPTQPTQQHRHNNATRHCSPMRDRGALMVSTTAKPKCLTSQRCSSQHHQHHGHHCCPC